MQWGVERGFVCYCCSVLAGSERATARFTQRQIDARRVLYKFDTSTSEPTSWLTVDSSQQHWPSQRDSFQLTVTTAGAEPLSHKSVLLLQ